MNKEKILDEIGSIPDRFIEEARPKGKRKRLVTIVGPIAAALVLIVGAALLLPKFLSGGKAAAPQSAPAADNEQKPADTREPVSGTPAGEEGEGSVYLLNAGVRAAQDRSSAKSVQSIRLFTEGLTGALMDGADGNTVFSPAGVYIALGMLGETAEGASLDEILNALGAESLTSVRANSRALLASESADDGRTYVSLANSLWINNKYACDSEILEGLANDYSASSYWGDPADNAFSAALRSWLNTATGGLLKESVDGVNLDLDTVMALFSAVCFRSPWRAPYSENLTDNGIFHTPDGDVVRYFMHRTKAGRLVFEGEGFVAVCEDTDGGRVWYLLPDEGVSPVEMLENGGYDFMFSDKNAAQKLLVNLTVPRLDASRDTDLIPALNRMGVVSCFSPLNADFTRLTGEGLFVSKADHSARIVTDEEGIMAAAYTQIDLAPNSAKPPEAPRVIDIVINRPFVMFVTGVSGQPLFIGIINDPVN